MLSAVYRSPKRDQTYLYIEKKGDFSRVPETLLAHFGQPQFVMLLPLDGSKKTVVEWRKLKDELVLHGYYLQLPPLSSNLLEQHKQINDKSEI